MTWVCPLKHKADFVNQLFKMDAVFLNQYGRHVGTLCTDNGGEYVNQQLRLRDYCNWHGILLELTIPHTPQQNGVAERANWTLTECMHAMMKDTDCPMALWGKAVCAAAYCLNCTSTSVNGGMTPFQAFEGTVPDISHMRVFYANTYIHHSKSEGAKKLGDCACLVKFVGYPEGVSGYKSYDPSTCTIMLSHSPHFLETLPDPAQLHTHTPRPPDDDEVSIASNSEQTPESHLLQIVLPFLLLLLLLPHLHLWIPLWGIYVTALTFTHCHSLILPTLEHMGITLLMTWNGNNISWFDPDDTIEDLSDTLTLKAALAGPEKDWWVCAICSELDNIIYELVNPKDHKVNNLLGNKIVLVASVELLGRSKSIRLASWHKVTINENLSTLRKLLHLLSNLHLSECSLPCVPSFHTAYMHHMDVTSAFLNGILNETVYMKQPKGFEEPGKEGWVWRLKKVLYGLKQGGHEWYHCIDNFLTNSLGLTWTFADHSVYVYENHNSVIFIPLYVSNLLIGYCDNTEMECIKSSLEHHCRQENGSMHIPPMETSFGHWNMSLLLQDENPIIGRIFAGNPNIQFFRCLPIQDVISSLNSPNPHDPNGGTYVWIGGLLKEKWLFSGQLPN